jgi:hypothetical protein
VRPHDVPDVLARRRTRRNRRPTIRRSGGSLKLPVIGSPVFGVGMN